MWVGHQRGRYGKPPFSFLIPYQLQSTYFLFIGGENTRFLSIYTVYSRCGVCIFGNRLAYLPVRYLPRDGEQKSAGRFFFFFCTQSSHTAEPSSAGRA